VNAITVQNEPQNRTPSGYPGTDMPSAQEEKVIEDLGPMLRAAGLHTQIFAYDHKLDRTPQRRRGHPAGRERRHQRLPAETC